MSVSDGDNSISFVNRNEVGKVYRDLAKESKQKLDGLITKYTIYESQPLQVGGYESVSYEAQIAAAAAGADGRRAGALDPRVFPLLGSGPRKAVLGQFGREGDAPRTDEPRC